MYSDPPIVSAAPVYSPGGIINSSQRKRPDYTFPREQIKPSRPLGNSNEVVTRTIRPKLLSKPLKLEQLLEKETSKFSEGSLSPNAIRARSVDLPPEPSSVEKTIPTFTVAEDGRLNIPTPPSLENEIEPLSTSHRPDKLEIKPTKTSLDSVTYIGFVDFTTTIDDTVVIFRPKKTFRTATRNVLIPKITPTRTVSEQSSRPTRIPDFQASPDLESSEPERHRTTAPEEATPSVSKVPKLTSGINPLKSLLAARASRSNLFSKSTAAAANKRPRITLKPSLTPSRPSFGSPPSSGSSSRPVPPVLLGSKQNRAPEPGDLHGSIDTNSDVELVYKTLYTTYTYFTTFFRASTTRVKSREEVVSNIVTLTNILHPSDLASLKSSCEVDQTCVFASSSEPPAFTTGFIGRPNTKPIQERPRSGVLPKKDDLEEVRLPEDVNAILRTFYTTYTYFTTLFVDGTSSISTRTEIYSNVKSSGVPVSILSPESVSILPSSSEPPPQITLTSRPANPRRLEYSSIARDVSLQKDLTTTPETPEEEDDDIDSTTADPFIVVGITTEAEVTESSQEIVPTTTTSPLEDEDVDDEAYETTEQTPEPEDVTSKIVPEVENEVAETENLSTSVTPVMKTFYTTFTYFTTLFRNGTSYVTSNLETVTNTADALATPTVVQPSVTFFTTFTYWTTSIDGDQTIITSSEETRTDILPASVTDQLNVNPTKVEDAGIRFTQRPEVLREVSPTVGILVEPSTAPELESSQINPSSVQLSLGTPSLDSSQSTDSFEDLDDDFTLVSAGESSAVDVTKSSKASKPNRTLTPFIRPNLFRSRARNTVRPRGRTRTTVAIITRSDVTPTLIATPASSLLQLTPTFESSSGRLVSASLFSRGSSRFGSSSRVSATPTSVNPSEISPSSTKTDDLARPSIISNLRLRRPSPFRQRLKERQRLQLKRLRESSKSSDNTETEETETTPRPTVPVPRFPVGAPGRTPIFVSSRTENFSRRPKVVLESNKGEGSSTAVSPNPLRGRNSEQLRLQRERARARINSLFKRRRPSFIRPRPALEESGNEDAQDLVGQESRRRRRKRQVSSYSEFGARTRKRQTFHHRRPSSSSSATSTRQQRQQPQYFDTLDNPPFTAFGSYSSDSSSSAYHQTSPNVNAYESAYDNFSHQRSSSAATASSSRSRSNNHHRRQVRQQETIQTSRARSRFNPNRGRTRLRSRPATNVASEPEPTQRPSLRTRFRPRTISTGSRTQNTFAADPAPNRFSSGSRFGSSNFRRTTKPPRTSLFDYDYYDDYETDIEIQSSQNTVPDSITVTHHVPVMTVIPVRENGRDEFRDILTPSPSLEVIAATALKSTDVDGKPVIYANAITEEALPGTKVITFEALRATETTTITFTPTRIRGIRTRFSHIVPATIYNIQPVTTSIIEPVDQSQLLSQLLLQLLGSQADPLKASLGNPLLPNLGGVTPSPTQFITHTSTYVTTITNTESTVIPITLRGREIKTTVVQSNTEVVTATEFSTETIIAPTAPIGGLGGLPTLGGGLFQQQPQPQARPVLPDLQQQLLAAQLQQQLRLQQEQQLKAQLLMKQQQQQLLNEQLLSQINLDPNLLPNAVAAQAAPIVSTNPPAPIQPDPPAPSTSVITKFVSGKNPGEFSVLTSTVTIGVDDVKERRRREVKPSPVETVQFTQAPEVIDSGMHSAAIQEVELQSGLRDVETLYQAWRPEQAAIPTNLLDESIIFS